MYPRREFLAALASVPFLQSRRGAQVPPASIVGAAEGELVMLGARRSPVRVKVDSRGGRASRLGMITEDLAPGTGIPVHRHLAEDEIIFIHRGTGTVTIGEARHPADTGATVFVPQGVWHGLENTGADTLTMLAIYAPPGFEGYFREIGDPAGAPPRAPRTADEIRAIDRRFHVEYR
jgi:quercetin dioxygenase-like cupin family protein